MLYSIKDREDLENLNELVSLQDQVKVITLQDKHGKQNFHEDMKKVFELVTKSLENTSENLSKAITETSIKNIAFYLLSPLAKIFNPENSTQFKLVKDPSSNRINDLKIHKSIPITLYGNILTFRDTGKKFKLTGDLLEMITNTKFNVGLASLSDKKLMYDFAKEMHFDKRNVGNKSTRDRTLIDLLNSPRIVASGISKTIFLSSDPNELCVRLKMLLQEKQAGNNSDIINDEIVAIIDKLLEYKCITKKQHKQFLPKCNLL